MKAFTTRDVKGAKAARKLNAKLLYPPNADFKWFIKNNQIKKANCWFGILIPLNRYGKRTSVPLREIMSEE